MDTNKRDHDIDHDDMRNPEVSYERTDLGARGIILFFIGLAVFGILASFAVAGLYRAFSVMAAKLDPPQNPMVKVEPVPQPGIMQNTAGANTVKYPEPRLQQDDATDMDRFKWQQRAMLNAQPWQDESGAVHLPIEQAMKLVLQRGLPTRAAQPVDASDQTASIGQTDTGNRNMNQVQRPTDASSVPAETKKQ